MNIATALTSVAAGVTQQITLISSFDEPVTVVRIIGEVIMVPQADTVMVGHWAIYKSPGAVEAIEPDQSNDVTQGAIMHWQSVFVHSSTIGRMNNLDRASKVDIRVKRKLNPEDSIKMSLVSPAAYDHVVNLRCYVLLA